MMLPHPMLEAAAMRKLPAALARQAWELYADELFAGCRLRPAPLC